ncbi:MAG: hypothetical protein A2Y66_03795 [Nitrospirae bacterium RBG_13_41_22]|nr:MAG: hypothetical protein A2Y66_03795 [Nitrospirae bacterium RBG_13_41_22]
MKFTRREFLKYCSVAAGALGLTATDLAKLENAFAAEGGLKVVWLNGQACTGCTVSLANSMYYTTIQELLLKTPASQTLDINFIETLSTSSGQSAIDEAKSVVGKAKSLANAFAVVVEGAIPLGTPPNDPTKPANNPGEYCTLWVDNGTEETMWDMVREFILDRNCAYVFGIGTCACYGGIPGAEPNPTHACGLWQIKYYDKYFKGTFSSTGDPWYPDSLLFWDLLDSTTQSEIRILSSRLRSLPREKYHGVIMIPGCPPNPNWIVGTIAYIIINNMNTPSLEALGRPVMYFRERICNSCDRFNNSVSGQFIINRDPDQIGDPNKNRPNGYCLKYIGCKGSRTKSDCSMRKWHSPGDGQIGVNWCVGAGAPCQGCTQDAFPDRMSAFFAIR